MCILSTTNGAEMNNDELIALGMVAACKAVTETINKLRTTSDTSITAIKELTLNFDYEMKREKVIYHYGRGIYERNKK